MNSERITFKYAETTPQTQEWRALMDSLLHRIDQDTIYPVDPHDVLGLFALQEDSPPCLVVNFSRGFWGIFDLNTSEMSSRPLDGDIIYRTTQRLSDACFNQVIALPNSLSPSGLCIWESTQFSITKLAGPINIGADCAWGIEFRRITKENRNPLYNNPHIYGTVHGIVQAEALNGKK